MQYLFAFQNVHYLQNSITILCKIRTGGLLLVSREGRSFQSQREFFWHFSFIIFEKKSLIYINAQYSKIK